jgi:rhodanese-related sulfurtransferase
MFRRRVAEMSPTEVAAIRRDVQVVDVRQPGEWQAGHIAGAIHIPLHTLPDRLAEVDGSRPVVVVCRSGNRSAHATQFLAQHGLDARNLSGGVQAWRAAGQELVAADGRPGLVG